MRADDLQDALARLVTAVRDLCRAAEELRLAAVEDRPASADALVVDSLADATMELEGRSVEAAAALVPVTPSGALPAVRVVAGALIAVHPPLDRATDAFWRDVLDRTLVTELLARGRAGGPEWRAWTRGVLGAAERLGPQLTTARAALAEAWRELADSAGLLRPDPITTLA